MTPLRVGVIGAGRVGAVLAAVLRSRGHEIVSVAGESDASLRRAADLLPGKGGVVRRGLAKLAVYRDEHGVCHEHSAMCPHLGCVVAWNDVERTWDCPCHGSRFHADGTVRSAYRALHDAIAPTAAADLAVRSEALDRAFVDQGITFSLSGKERPFPLDIVPRVISAAASPDARLSKSFAPL